MESLDTRLAIKKERKKDNAITTDLLVSSTGPASRRWYQTIHPNAKQSSSSLAPLLPRLSALTLFLSSNAFREFLQRVTGLSLKTFTSSSSLEVRRFTVGSYTLLHDEDSGDHHQNEETKSFSGLDVQFHLIKKSTSTTTTKNEEDERTSDSSTAVVCGGETIYVADSETLLTLYPQENTLCLVLRDEGVMRFVRYLGVKSPLAMNNNNSNSGVRGQCDVAMAWQVEEDEDDEKKEEEV